MSTTKAVMVPELSLQCHGAPHCAGRAGGTEEGALRQLDTPGYVATKAHAEGERMAFISA